MDLPALLKLAAAPVLRSIRRDTEQATFQVKPLLIAIGEQLFDSGLQVKSLRRDCRIHDREVLRRFHQQTGQTVKKYFTARRMEVAASLLATTDLAAGQITDLVGYSTLAAFSRAFMSWSGLRPTEYRRRHGRDQSTLQVLESRPAVAGTPAERIDALLDWLRRLQTHCQGQGAEVRPGQPIQIDGRLFERSVALEVWEALREVPWAEQRSLLREQIRFTSPELLHLLCQKSREEGRRDRQRGVQVAQLALDHLHGSGELLGAELPSLTAQAWAWLGNAYRLARNFPAAEQALTQSEEALPRYGALPLVKAELLQIKAAMRWMQARLDDALDLANSAVPLFRTLGEPVSLAQVLLLRSNIVRHARDPRQAFGDLEEAESLLQGEADSYLAGALYTSWIDLHLMSGNLDVADEILINAREYLAAGSDCREHSVLCWLEGRAASAHGSPLAESSLRQAQQGFREQHDLLLAAVVSLDLALLYLEQDQHQRTLTELAEAIPAFEALSADPGLFAALSVLQKAVREGELAAATIQRLHRLATEQAFHP